MNKLYLLIFILFLSCSHYYRTNFEEVKASVSKERGSFIFGSYSYSEKFCFLGGRIVLDIKKDGERLPNTFIAFDKERGIFVFPVKPGKYNVVALRYISDYTYDVFDSQIVSHSFEIGENQFVYLGSFIPNLSFDVEYIYWGISEVSNNFEKDKKLLNEMIGEVKNFEFTSAVPEKLGKIKKLKYSPGSYSNFTATEGFSFGIQVYYHN